MRSMAKGVAPSLLHVPPLLPLAAVMVFASVA